MANRKFFPKLTQTHVFVELDTDGNGFNCPMLPISKLDEFNRCAELLKTVKDLRSYAVVQKAFLTLINTVLPAEYQENLKRFDLDNLAEFTAYLMYGDDCNDLPQGDTVKKKEEPKTPPKS